MESIVMKGGDGPYSYRRNSMIQREGLKRIKPLVYNGIQEMLDLDPSASDHVFRIADLGCSVGPNTYECVENIIEAVEHKYRCHGRLSSISMPEFQVFFNDHAANDFNTLFLNLPSHRHRRYMAAGVPGSFYGRLFPKKSLNFINSSYTLHWLSRVPKEVTDEKSPAWNKGRISYVDAPHQVSEAYTAQFGKDMEKFLVARADEMVSGGLMTLLIAGRPEGIAPADSVAIQIVNCLGSVLMDMTKQGLVNEALVDSFNLPIFFPTASELKEVIERNGSFSIQRMENLCISPMLHTSEHARIRSLNVRATIGDTVCKHFGSQIVDEVFDRYRQKLEELGKMPSFTEKYNELFVTYLKRN
ncbi:PREDICTED: probable S-adenosylmethionine-dependent methyltransferase At5g37990 isoform X2 [Nelumbo nucifera]|uniref:Probable S-adenosylmethionine-dependent methyltransferase At5g37990 isoform X2 n=1 Tax=Nelumbo nucifera TaxID=4432 RepID=A0A1U7YWH4_NELNU|nr:PREDICTED: probable S-adenosylmethionine-dependent methyltransferase At5g37990 isoform X2 [Nelumbo nucifera]